MEKNVGKLINSVLFHLIPQAVSWMQPHLHVDSFSEQKKGKLYPRATNEVHIYDEIYSSFRKSLNSQDVVNLEILKGIWFHPCEIV